jgi:hypothetical protein
LEALRLSARPETDAAAHTARRSFERPLFDAHGGPFRVEPRRLQLGQTSPGRRWPRFILVAQTSARSMARRLLKLLVTPPFYSHERTLEPP